MIEPKSIKDLVALRAEFDRCWPWLWESLCEFGPTHSKEQVWFRIASGKAFLWPGKVSVILGEFIDHPIGYRSFNYWLQGGVQGRSLKELLSMHPGIEAWADSQGCKRVMRSGREGWTQVMEGDWKKGPMPAWKWLGEPPMQARP
jgi:hypothetical protein